MSRYERFFIDCPPSTILDSLMESVRSLTSQAKLKTVENRIFEIHRAWSQSPEGRLNIFSGRDVQHRLEIALLWWTDFTGRKHTGIRVIRGAAPNLRRHRAVKERNMPPVLNLYPQHTFLYRRSTASSVWAFCRCGVVGPVEELGWMGGSCGPCFDREQEPEHMADRLGSLVHELEVAIRPILHWNPNGLEVLIQTGTSIAHLVNVEQGTKLKYVNRDSRDTMATVFLSDRELLVHCVRLSHWELGETDRVREIRGLSSLSAGIPCRNGRALIASKEASEIIIYRYPPLEEISRVYYPRLRLSPIEFVNRGENLVLGQLDGQLSFFDVTTGNHVETIPGHSTEIDRMLLLPKQDRLLTTGCGEGTRETLYWDLKKRTMIRQWRLPHQAKWATTSADGRFGVAQDEWCLYFYSLAKGALAFTIELAEHQVSTAVTSPDGQWLALTTVDGTLRIWPWHGLTQMLHTAMAPEN